MYVPGYIWLKRTLRMIHSRLIGLFHQAEHPTIVSFSLQFFSFKSHNYYALGRDFLAMHRLLRSPLRSIGLGIGMGCVEFMICLP
jgi:hypothetical protein